MPLNKKGKEIMSSMKRQYGPKKGEEVFYASKNKGKIKNVERAQEGGAMAQKAPKKKPGDEIRQVMSKLEAQKQQQAQQQQQPPQQQPQQPPQRMRGGGSLKCPRDGMAVRGKTKLPGVGGPSQRMKSGGKICPEGKAWAKRTFDKYPSAYANLAASKYCKDPNYAKGSKGGKRKGK